jgi:hypothetical protein
MLSSRVNTGYPALKKQLYPKSTAGVIIHSKHRLLDGDGDENTVSKSICFTGLFFARNRCSSRL